MASIFCQIFMKTLVHEEENETSEHDDDEVTETESNLWPNYFPGNNHFWISTKVRNLVTFSQKMITKKT